MMLQLTHSNFARAPVDRAVRYLVTNSRTLEGTHFGTRSLACRYMRLACPFASYVLHADALFAILAGMHSLKDR